MAFGLIFYLIHSLAIPSILVLVVNAYIYNCNDIITIHTYRESIAMPRYITIIWYSWLLPSVPTSATRTPSGFPGCSMYLMRGLSLDYTRARSTRSAGLIVWTHIPDPPVWLLVGSSDSGQHTDRSSHPWSLLWPRRLLSATQTRKTCATGGHDRVG